MVIISLLRIGLWITLPNRLQAPPHPVTVNKIIHVYERAFINLHFPLFQGGGFTQTMVHNGLLLVDFPAKYDSQKQTFGNKCPPHK